MHISLDGFVAGPNGEMDWIKADEELFDYVGKRIVTTDTALYGRRTFEMMEGYWPTAADQPNASKHDIEHAQWYRHANKLVLSTTMQAAGLNNTTVISNNIAAHIQQVKQQPGSDILVFGSPSATHALMQLNLIDGYWLFVNPVILGQGIPLFTNIKQQVKLKLLGTHTFGIGVTELNYVVEQ